MEMERIFKTAVEISHFILTREIKPGDMVVDATCGNGSDTLLLAELVGHSGHVFGFDIQPQAISNTREKLKEAGLENRATLYNVGHELLDEYIKMPINTILFNLGYLPGACHRIITTKETTLAGVRAGMNLLKPKGMVIAVLYPGHEGGQEEAVSLIEFAQALPKKDWDVVNIAHLNRSSSAPQVLVLQKVFP
jgi:SAM-dependent methyltransferase